MKRLIVLILAAVLVSSCVSVSAAPGGNSVTTPGAGTLPGLGGLGGSTGASGNSAPAGNRGNANATTAGGRQAYAAHLPNPQLTPGDALDVTTKDICQPGYTQKVRDVPESVKNEIYKEYGITSHQPGEYEVDHLISLELGGSNSTRNLWPEPYQGDWNAHEKDKLENELHKRVCDGQMDLKTAQQAIATDWIAAYEKYVGQGK